jgi:ribosomal protein S18 acetylase RimI-like enzyme
MIEVRPARQEELGMLRKVAIDTFIASFAEFNTAENMEAFLMEAYRPDTLEKEWREEGSICYLAWEENDLLGFVRLRRNDEVEDQLGKNTIELQRLYVHPVHQGKKIGSLMMKQAVDYSGRQGYDWIWLGVWERNFKAQEFYVKWGFEKFSEHIFQMGDDPQVDWLLRRKVIR